METPKKRRGGYRPNGGRKAGPDGKKVLLQIMVSPANVPKLALLAQRRGMSRQKLINWWIEDAWQYAMLPEDEPKQGDTE